MSELIGGVIRLLLTNFTLTFFAAGVVVAIVVIAVTRPGRHGVLATFLNWFLLFAVGVTYAFNGVMHVFFGGMSAASIGWADSPFQTEVGFASLGVGIVGIMASPRRMPWSLKFAALIGPACFLWGAAGTHIVDIVETGNLAPNNAGVILYTDLLTPLLGFILWWAAYATRDRGPARPEDADARR